MIQIGELFLKEGSIPGITSAEEHIELTSDPALAAQPPEEEEACWRALMTSEYGWLRQP